MSEGNSGTAAQKSRGVDSYRESRSAECKNTHKKNALYCIYFSVIFFNSFIVNILMCHGVWASGLRAVAGEHVPSSPVARPFPAHHKAARVPGALRSASSSLQLPPAAQVHCKLTERSYGVPSGRWPRTQASRSAGQRDESVGRDSSRKRASRLPTCPAKYDAILKRQTAKREIVELGHRLHFSSGPRS